MLLWRQRSGFGPEFYATPVFSTGATSKVDGIFPTRSDSERFFQP